MSTWKIYAHQSGAARCYIMRKFEGGAPVQTARFSHHDIERMRDLMRCAGLHCQPRQDGDEPAMVEAWQ